MNEQDTRKVLGEIKTLSSGKGQSNLNPGTYFHPASSSSYGATKTKTMSSALSGKTKSQTTPTTNTQAAGDEMDDCGFCNRAAANVICNSCGYNMVGRVRKACSLHPLIIQLMDHGTCPKCHSSRMQEFPRSAHHQVPSKLTTIPTAQDTEEYWS